MLPIPSKALLSGSLKTALPLLLAAALAAYSYRAGYLKRDAAAKLETAQIQQVHAAARLKAEQEYSAKLAAAEHTLEQKQHAIRQEIPHAIRKDNADGRCFGGLGADSLRLYRQAFGYSAD